MKFITECYSTVDLQMESHLAKVPPPGYRMYEYLTIRSICQVKCDLWA